VVDTEFLGSRPSMGFYNEIRHLIKSGGELYRLTASCYPPIRLLKGAAMRLLPLAFLLSTSAFAESYTCSPVSRTNIAMQGSNTVTLSDVEAKESTTKIDTSGAKYLWTSRANTPLSKDVSGDFTIFHAENGAGIVKISTGKEKGVKGKAHPYFEMASIGLDVLIYNGACSIQ